MVDFDFFVMVEVAIAKDAIVPFGVLGLWSCLEKDASGGWDSVPWICSCDLWIVVSSAVHFYLDHAPNCGYR